MPLLLFIAYPVLAHLGVLLHLPLLQWLALLALFAAVLYQPLRGGRALAWLGFAVYAALTLLLARAGGGIYALYIPPLALLGLAWLGFARSLRAGATPLVTQIATTVHGTLSLPLQHYTRQVTQAWTVLLALLFLVTLLLTVTGPRAWWSLQTNVINYSALGLAFVVDYLWRRWRFPGHDRDGFIGFIRTVARNGRVRPR